MGKRMDKAILIWCITITTILLLVFVPKNKMREAHVAFLFKQAITWLFGLLIVEKNLISYPTRLFFKKANKSSFIFEYYVYPAICALFNVHYPETGNKLVKFLYYFYYTSSIIVFELFAVKYTGLIHYKKWNGYWSFITIWLSYYVSRLYQRWFFKTKPNYIHISTVKN